MLAMTPFELASRHGLQECLQTSALAKAWSNVVHHDTRSGNDPVLSAASCRCENSSQQGFPCVSGMLWRIPESDSIQTAFRQQQINRTPHIVYMFILSLYVSSCIIIYIYIYIYCIIYTIMRNNMIECNVICNIII